VAVRDGYILDTALGNFARVKVERAALSLTVDHTGFGIPALGTDGQGLSVQIDVSIARPRMRPVAQLDSVVPRGSVHSILDRQEVTAAVAAHRHHALRTADTQGSDAHTHGRRVSIRARGNIF
jgi:hypothetical protein